MGKRRRKSRRTTAKDEDTRSEREVGNSMIGRGPNPARCLVPIRKGHLRGVKPRAGGEGPWENYNRKCSRRDFTEVRRLAGRKTSRKNLV